MTSGAISFTRYVDIVSGVGAGTTVRNRQLIGRFFTENELLPPKSFIEFESADEALTYFGSTSEEYKRTAFYFGWVSKNITSAQKISFARWVSTATPSKIFGKVATRAVGDFTSISAGSFSLTLAGVTHQITGINMSGATSLTNVASIVQTAVQAYSAGGASWTAATVTYNATRKSFNLVGGAAGDDVVAVSAGTTGTDLAGPLGWLTGAIMANGSEAETLTETLALSDNASNNFGSFEFLGGRSFTTSQHEEVAIWNATKNLMYQYMVPVTASNAATLSEALMTYPGCALTLSPLSSEYPQMIPSIILAATNYAARNGTQNYMFQQFSVTPSVTTDEAAASYDALRVNYYGQTQTAGQYLAFYQRGQLTGQGTAPTDQNVYGNEQWLKDNAGAAVMSLLLSLAKVSANTQGRAQIMTVLQDTASQALTNGTISVGKTLNAIQKLYITNATGDNQAWQQVQNIGYWLDVAVQSFVDTSGATEYKAVYTFLYSKDDVIRKVEGSHVLI